MQRRNWLLSAGRMAAASVVLPGATMGLQGCREWVDGGVSRGVAGGFVGPDMARGHAWRERVQSGQWSAPAVMHRRKVLIAGGGMAGLAAARALRLAGESDFALLELEDAAGGNSRGHTLQGQPCPLGAHYLPVPGDDAPEVQDWLEELGLRQRVAGRWQYDERHLCHSPQERLFLHGAWQEGVLPHEGVPASTLAQYQRMAALVQQLQQQAPFTMPAWRGWQHGRPLHAVHAELDAQTMASWLARHGLDDPYLHWFLNYCCRDDYGAGIHTVSAWAGLHYFASRGGFHAPSHDAEGADDNATEGGVLTWPEGNGWLVQQLVAPLLEAQLQRGQAVLRIATDAKGVTVDVWHEQARRVERWWGERCVVALPAFIAQRVVQTHVPALHALAGTLGQAPWLVSNLHLNGPLAETGDMPLAWDSVVFDDPNPGALGYVHSGHQRLDARTPQPSVLTYYQALGDVPGARRLLAETPWTHWRDAVLQSVRRMHPDLDERLTEVSVTRHGHAMAVPAVGRLALVHGLAMQAAAAPARVVVAGEAVRVAPVVHDGRLAFAHADWAAYSVLEEAFTRGHHAGVWAAAASSAGPMR